MVIFMDTVNTFEVQTFRSAPKTNRKSSERIAVGKERGRVNEQRYVLC